MERMPIPFICKCINHTKHCDWHHSPFFYSIHCIRICIAFEHFDAVSPVFPVFPSEWFLRFHSVIPFNFAHTKRMSSGALYDLVTKYCYHRPVELSLFPQCSSATLLYAGTVHVPQTENRQTENMDMELANEPHIRKKRQKNHRWKMKRAVNVACLVQHFTFFFLYCFGLVPQQYTMRLSIWQMSGRSTSHLSLASLKTRHSDDNENIQNTYYQQPFDISRATSTEYDIFGWSLFCIRNNQSPSKLCTKTLRSTWKWTCRLDISKTRQFPYVRKISIWTHNHHIFDCEYFQFVGDDDEWWAVCHAGVCVPVHACVCVWINKIGWYAEGEKEIILGLLSHTNVTPSGIVQSIHLYLSQSFEIL